MKNGGQRAEGGGVEGWNGGVGVEGWRGRRVLGHLFEAEVGRLSLRGDHCRRDVDGARAPRLRQDAHGVDTHVHLGGGRPRHHARGGDRGGGGHSRRDLQSANAHEQRRHAPLRNELVALAAVEGLNVEARPHRRAQRRRLRLALRRAAPPVRGAHVPREVGLAQRGRVLDVGDDLVPRLEDGVEGHLLLYLGRAEELDRVRLRGEAREREGR